MKKILFLFALIILLVACNPDKYTFEKGFNEVLALDEKYGGSFYDESIDPGNLYKSSLFLPVQGRILVPLENIDPFIADLDLLKGKVSQMQTNNHTTSIIEFIELRKTMLEMERYYHLGEAQKESLVMGPKRSAIISIRGFKCGEAPKIAETAEYYNISAKLGKEAVEMLDDLLTYNQEDPNIPTILGVQEHRPKFFDGPFWPMIKVMNANVDRVKQYCNK